MFANNTWDKFEIFALKWYSKLAIDHFLQFIITGNERKEEWQLGCNLSQKSRDQIPIVVCFLSACLNNQCLYLVQKFELC